MTHRGPAIAGSGVRLTTQHSIYVWNNHEPERQHPKTDPGRGHIFFAKNVNRKTQVLRVPGAYGVFPARMFFL